MERSTTWVQAIVDPKLYPYMPGAIIRLWGHDFKIYTDKSLCMEMPNEFVSSEVKAGRVKVLNGLPPGIVEVDLNVPEHKKVRVELEKPQFTLDVSSYFGSGSLNQLINDLEKHTVEHIKEFAKDRFEMEFPARTLKADMLDEIRTMTDLKIIELNKK